MAGAEINTLQSGGWKYEKGHVARGGWILKAFKKNKQISAIAENNSDVPMLFKVLNNEKRFTLVIYK